MERHKEIAERLSELLEEIRGEIAAASSGESLKAVGALTCVEEAATLLELGMLRMGWTLPGDQPRRGGTATTNAGELVAAVRYVVTTAPTLAPALTWAICSAPDLVAEISSTPPAPGALAALAELDEALAAIVAASPAGFRRSGQVWQKPAAAEGPS